MSLTKITTDIALANMHPIGSVENLGAKIISGEVKAYALGTFGAPTDPVSSGYFAVTKGSFQMVYPFNEQATIVQGAVKLTDVTTGISKVYLAGDSWFVTKGTEVIWEVETDHCMKHFFAVV